MVADSESDAARLAAAFMLSSKLEDNLANQEAANDTGSSSTARVPANAVVQSRFAESRPGSSTGRTSVPSGTFDLRRVQSLSCYAPLSPEHLYFLYHNIPKNHRRSQTMMTPANRGSMRSIDLIEAVTFVNHGTDSNISMASTLANPKEINHPSMANLNRTEEGIMEEISLADDAGEAKHMMHSETPSIISSKATGSDGKPPLSPDVEKQPQELPLSVPKMSKAREIAFIINVCLAQFISLAGLAQTIAPLVIIGDSFGIQDPGILSWFTASYSLAVGTLILPAGRLGDMYGHKRLFLIGWAWFACWTLICGFTDNYGHVFFNVCRALQGAGPALLVPNAMALIGRTFPAGMKRNLVFSCFGAAGPTGFYFGAILASSLSQLTSWPWAFRALAIIQTVILVASYFVIPSPPAPVRLTCATRPPTPTPTAAPPRPKFDFFGCVTGVTALVLINFALNQAPISGWSRAYIWETLIMGLAFLCFFLFIELRYATQPLIPLKGLKKEAAFALSCIVCGWGAHGIWLYYMFLFQENLRGHSALMASVQLTPVAITGVVFALSTGYLLRKMNAAWVMFLAMMFFTIGAVFIATAPVNQTYWANTFLSVLVMPGGMNLSFPAGMILLSNAMPPEHQGIAASLVATMVNYSISCGLGLAASVEEHVSNHGEDVLAGYQGAWYLGLGITVLGWVISGWFVYKSWGKK